MLGLYLGLFLLAGASLGLEITLTRVFALAQWYHFSFVAISMALLGTGAGGTLLTIWPGWKHNPRRTAETAALLCALSILGSYVIANYLPFDAYLIALEPVQILYLAVYYLVLALPFFWVSLSTGVLLASAQGKGHQVYAVNLLGSACGCILALVMQTIIGGAGAVAGFAAMAALASLAFGWARPLRWPHLGTALITALIGATLLIIRPNWFEIRLSAYKGLPQLLQTQDANLVSTRWNASSRVDVVASPALHAAPGLTLSCQAPEPQQQAVFVDGDNPSPYLIGSPNALAAWANCLPLALAYELRPKARALILEPGGNLDVQAALALNAGEVTVVEPNQLLVDAAHGYPGSQVAVETSRVFLRRTDTAYDLIDLALSGSRSVVSVGAFSLNEEYRYTTNALTDALNKLNENGILVISRWLQSPPSEELRAWALAVTALEQRGVSSPGQHLAALRSWSILLILVSNRAFSPSELAVIREFSKTRQFDLVFLPDLTPAEINIYQVYPVDPYVTPFRELLNPVTRSSLYAASAFNIRPPTDDHPFFFHFFTWRQLPELLTSLGKTWKPFGGSGYLVIYVHLVVALILALLLISLPVIFGKRSIHFRLYTALYFGLLGIGYLAVEIPLIQRFILLLGNPTTAFAVVAANLLLFSGVGSLLVYKLPGRWPFIALVLALVVIILLLGPLFNLLTGNSMVIRLLASSLILAPLGILMGMPFPIGLARLVRESPEMVSWAWAVNGSVSVVSSIGVAMLALASGFTAVLGLAAASYFLAALFARKMKPLA